MVMKIPLAVTLSLLLANVSQAEAQLKASVWYRGTV